MAENVAGNRVEDNDLDGTNGNNDNLNVDDSGNDEQLGDPTEGIRTIERGSHPADCGCPRCIARRDTGTTRRRKPRKSAKSGKKNNLDLKAFSLQLEGIHKLASMFTKQPLLEISKDESEQMAQAIQAVLLEYNLKPSPKVMAWTQLVAAASAIYGPRLIVIQAMKKKQKAQQMPIPTMKEQRDAQAQMSPEGMIKYD